jgi:ABC-2 type transport system permease protein
MRVLTLVRRSAAQSWPLLLACSGLLAGFQFVLVAGAASIEESQMFGRMAEFLPSFLQRGLGQQALLLATFHGSIAFGYFHPVIVVLVALVSAYFATEPGYDVESGRVDLVLARAVPRRRVITRSLLLSVFVVVLIVCMMAAGTWTGLYAFTDGRGRWPPAALIGKLALHLAAVAWCVGAFGLAVGAGASRWTTAFATVVVTTILMYWIDFAAIGWAPAGRIEWITPFDYFPALAILSGTAPPWRNLLVLWSATAVFWAIAYWRFQRRDL